MGTSNLFLISGLFFFPFGLLLFCVVQFYFGGLGQQRRMPVAAAEQKDRRHRAATGADGKAGDTPKEVSTDIWPIGGSTAPAALKDTQNVAGKKETGFPQCLSSFSLFA